MSPEEEALVESACTAWRPRATDGSIQFHPAWHDLDAGGRREVFERTVQLRALEQALAPDGMSTTARAVLARIARRA